MRVCVGLSITMTTLAIIFRQARGFVAPLRTTTRQAGPTVVSTNVRFVMSAGAATPPAQVGAPILDAEAAELKAERLWGMADAQKPWPMEIGEMGLSEEAEMESRRRGSQKLSLMEGVDGADNFVEEPGETSALRRYQYNELLDDESGDDDGKEYYI